MRAVGLGARPAGVARAMLLLEIMKRALFVVFLLGCPLVAGRLGSAPIDGDAGAGPVADGTASQSLSAKMRTQIAAHEAATGRDTRSVRVVPSAPAER